ncbi:MAG TPA: class I SAM-dependent rRNA methyltransferase [Candidatus Methylacidiphilales bacterium]|nr:class I SAM-dependent rRNA methyltransferase [Candidatus Methylacidiphilales bacterium]
MIPSARLHLNKGVRHRILTGHPWVFASEVDHLEGDAEDGGTVEIVSAKGEFLGSAIYNHRSQIVARRYSRGKTAFNAHWIGQRLDDALAYRRSLQHGAAAVAQRLVWSESDHLPGLIADRYGDVIVLQTVTLAMARQEEAIARLLVEKTGVHAVIARNDAPVRQLEGLPLESRILHGACEGPVRLRIADVDYEIDLWSGQKTGFYLDQVANYAAIAAYAPSRRVLDCFCNQGAFAISAWKAGAASCRAIDQSAEALRLAERTAQAAGLAVEWVQGNVFDLLRQYEQRRENFDLIVLDPPSFTKTKGNKTSALRGYHELHLRAMRLLTRGGILATFSCSHHVTAEDWVELLQRAAAETGTILRLLQRLSQNPDHPVLVNIPETEYLHGYILEKVDGGPA